MLKFCFVVEFAVWKSSLVNRFFYNIFQCRYMATIGAKIQKVDLRVDQSRDIMTLWDIMGEKGFCDCCGRPISRGRTASLRSAT